MAALFLVGPLLRLAAGAGSRRCPRALPMLGYFACLGYGFMMLEVPLLQRFILLLGHPAYALVVVLFALLLFSGLGSLLSGRFAARGRSARWRVVLPAIIALGARVREPRSRPSRRAARPRPLAVRIAATIALLAPLGLLLGMPYPLGITILRRFGSRARPLGLGAQRRAGVVASVLAIFLGSRFGFTAALLTGIGAYALALVADLRPGSAAAAPVAAATAAARWPRVSQFSCFRIASSAAARTVVGRDRERALELFRARPSIPFCQYTWPRLQWG